MARGKGLALGRRKGRWEGRSAAAPILGGALLEHNCWRTKNDEDRSSFSSKTIRGRKAKQTYNSYHYTMGKYTKALQPEGDRELATL